MGSEIKRIIFLVEYPLAERDHERYGIELLRSNGFDVEVWDLTRVLHEKIYSGVAPCRGSRYEKCYSLSSKRDVMSKIGALSTGDIVILLIAYNTGSFWIYRRVSRALVPYCLFRANSMPFAADPNRKDASRSIRILKKLLDWRGLMNAVLVRIPCRFLDVAPASFILAGGDMSVLTRWLIGPETETIWLHALDYDIYLKEKATNVAADPKVGVFIDENVPFHPDYMHMKVDPFSTPEAYFPVLKTFFDHMEVEHGVRIVIAAHPRSHYKTPYDYFGDRVVIKGKTVDLIRKSGFVLTHCSTAVNVAVLEKKPILFLTTDSLEKSVQGGWIKSMASYMNKTVINIDEQLSVNMEEESRVDETAYRLYKNAFIKKDGSEEDVFWQIFADKMKALKIR